ncbi:MAG: Asp-tRNA(Asn)/Glu-tRNA(Gln) amidotransferase subunit GatA [Proteobacteria bacterium]|nr:Asp-tRNA(Asn)/Glu-tRNA(Gln) amidotransferase subunit GatA [Pseudomonadota bacterium]
MDIKKLTLEEIRNLIESRVIKVRDVTEFYLKRAKELQEKTNAFITLDEENILNQVENLEKELERGFKGKLTGVPIAIKDNICTKNIRTTCASKILYNFIPPYDATVVERLKKEGAIIFGKTNMDEFAMGSSNETSYFGPVKNPWDWDRIPGGSSGGSAVAISAIQAPASLGSDTGGSIRQPASLCGVIGMKPTYGRVSRYGLIAFGSSLDQIGPFARTTKDCALVLEVISGYDPKDSTSINRENPEYSKGLSKDIRGLKIGVPKEYFIDGVEEDIVVNIQKAIDTFKNLGAEIYEISLPHTKYGIAVYYLIATAEASSNLARYDGVKYGYRAQNVKDLKQMYIKTKKEGFGEEVKRRIMLGTFSLASGYYDAYYKKASKVRTLIKQDFMSAFEKVDVILCPTSPTTAFKIGEKSNDPIQMYLSDIFTINVNLAGVPAMSIPCGFDRKGLPIGMQIMGNYFEEQKILNTSYAYESAVGGFKFSPFQEE